MLASYINCQVMSSKSLKQKDFSSVASNESQLTLVSLVGNEREEDGEGHHSLRESQSMLFQQPVTAVPRLVQQRTYMPVYISTSTWCTTYWFSEVYVILFFC